MLNLCIIWQHKSMIAECIRLTLIGSTCHNDSQEHNNCEVCVDIIELISFKQVL